MIVFHEPQRTHSLVADLWGPPQRGAQWRGKGVVKGIGKVLGAPVKAVAGVANKIPIVKGLVGKPLSHIGGALAGDEPFLKGLVSGGAPLLLGAGTFGLGPAAGLLSKAGGLIGGKAGQTLASTIGSKIPLSTIVKGGVDFVKRRPLDAAQMALAGLNTVQGAQRAGTADALRSRALGRLDETSTPDLSGVFGDPYDPYAQHAGQNRARRAALASITGGY